jgi:serine protease Do
LADAEGRVIGINTMVSGSLAFAVPSNAVLTFLKRASAEDGGAKLGVLVRPLVLRRREAKDKPLFCIQILEVEPGSAAAAASLRRGDLLVGANGDEFRSLDDLDSAIGSHDLLRLEFRRGDMKRTRTVSVQFGSKGGGRRSEAA